MELEGARVETRGLRGLVCRTVMSPHARGVFTIVARVVGHTRTTYNNQLQANKAVYGFRIARTVQ